MAVFNDEEQQRIRTAVENAEKHTSGQIRVCIEKTSQRQCAGPCRQVFLPAGYAQNQTAKRGADLCRGLCTVSLPLLAMPV